MFIDYTRFEENLARVRDQIGRATVQAGRPKDSVKLLPVTKNHPVDAAEFALRAGLAQVGENRVQEALSKMETASDGLLWELIGPLQSNKAKRVAEQFYRVQTVDRAKVANALQRHAAESGKSLRVLLQVNAGRDPNKSGVSLEDAEALLELVLGCDCLEVDGLMTIAPLDDDPSVARRCFAALRECRDRLSQVTGAPLTELSMGMSGDLEAAILEGSTLVRVGTALYGERHYE